jgi:hypothetical protein
LSLSSKRCINYTNLTNSTNSRSQISTSFGKQINIKTQQTISSLFKLNSSQQNTSSCTSFYMSFRLPQMQWHLRYFNSKSLKESPPQKQLTTRINIQSIQQQIRSGSCSTIQQKQTWKHSQTSYQSIEYLQISSSNFSCTTSTQSNQQKHRQKSTLIKYIKTKQIQSCKSSKQKTFQSQLQSIKRLAMLSLSIPTTLYSLWHQSCCQLHHPKTQTIQSKFLLNCKQSIPIHMYTNHLLKRFDSCRYKTRPQTNTLYQCTHCEKLSEKTMFSRIFSWLYTNKKRTPQWLLLYNR